MRLKWAKNIPNRSLPRSSLTVSAAGVLAPHESRMGVCPTDTAYHLDSNRLAKKLGNRIATAKGKHMPHVIIKLWPVKSDERK